MSVFANFRSLRKFITPRWLTDGEGGLVGYALDLVKDAFLQRLYQGHLARFPQNGPNGETAPADALIALGRDRRVVRGINETDAAYAVRLTTWLDDRATCGAPFSLLREISAYTGGCACRTVDERGNWFSRSASGVETYSLNTGNWNWDASTPAANWSRFWVIVYPGTLWTTPGQTWGTAGTWAHATATWGSTTITEEQTRTLQSIVADWKPDGTRCVNIILALDPASFNPASPEPDGTWGKSYKYSGGVAVPSRLSTARYLNGS